MNLVQTILAAILFIMVAPWFSRLSLDWLDSFRQWQIEDQYYRERKAELLLSKKIAILYIDNYGQKKPPFDTMSPELTDYLGKFYSDRLQSIDDELTQLREYYGY